MNKYYITDSKIKHTEKQGQRVADRMPTNVNKSTLPQPILSIINSLDILEKQAIKYDKYKRITGHPTKLDIEAHAPVFGREHPIPKETFDTIKRQPEHKLQREAIMQNSENISKEAINPFAVATAKAKEMGYTDFSEGSEGAEKRSEIAEAIKEKENIPISKATLLCKLDKQIIQLENRGIEDEYILMAYGSFDAIPEEFRNQENRPPANWFGKALDTMQKSDYTGNVYRYCLELWKSSDNADELLQKAIGVSSVKPLDDDELYNRRRLVDDAAPGGEAEEIRGDGVKLKTSDLKPVNSITTN